MSSITTAEIRIVTTNVGWREPPSLFWYMISLSKVVFRYSFLSKLEEYKDWFFVTTRELSGKQFCDICNLKRCWKTFCGFRTRSLFIMLFFQHFSFFIIVNIWELLCTVPPNLSLFACHCKPLDAPWIQCPDCLLHCTGMPSCWELFGNTCQWWLCFITVH